MPLGETLSHAPPFAVTALALKRNVDSSTAEMLITSGRGFDPPNGIVKLMGFICVNAAVPTVTVTGMVVVSPAVWKTSCPVKVPATSPPLGRFAAVIEIVAMEGAVPLVGVAVSHAPPSAVLVVTVQFSVPLPPLPICEERLKCQ